MLSLRPEDLIHKSQLNRLLMDIVDQPLLAHALAFKGGSCAAMLGYLDRFSVDLDFDVLLEIDKSKFRQVFHQVFDHLGLDITLEYKTALVFQLRYLNTPGKRSTIKISASDTKVLANQYRVQYFPEIDRLINSQSIETMFANKLVALTDRYTRHKSIAGRDLYDIHHFFVQGYAYLGGVILERTGLVPREYFSRLIQFIQEHFNQTVINEDLNSLLPMKQFQQVRKILIPETIALLEREVSRLGSD
ncbi:MAG: nucleotidyl transferase AbiEii/AbiGii toxin family protein [Anaerolineales bacterium]